MNRNKVKAMFLGIEIGDSLGMAVESVSAKVIAEKHGRITKYLTPKDHKWFKNHKAGTYTDDTALTIAIAEGMIDGFKKYGNPLNMDCQADAHVIAYKETTAGWGKSTKYSIRNLANNAPWNKCCELGDNLGYGNGVCMKIAPVGAYLAKIIAGKDLEEKDLSEQVVTIGNFVADISLMTHNRSISISAALAQVWTIFYCLICKPENFNSDVFIDFALEAAINGEQILPEGIKDKISDRFAQLKEYKDHPIDKIITDWKGSCYVYDSLPFTYAFFLKNPMSIESLYDVVSAGGDTDSNGSMLAALLGALHGTSIFPAHLVDELDAEQNKRVLDLADKFCDVLGIN